MLKKIFLAALIGITTNSVRAQMYESYVHEGEFGAAIGLAHYFGDLNTNAALNRPKFSAGIFYIKQFNNYVGLKLAADYARLGYSDIYSDNEVQRRRNLSFNTNLWEASASGYFNFFKFMPGVRGYHYTPYVSLGIGIFSYDPYTYLGGQKYFLRPLGTEGQGRDTLRQQPYGTMGLSFPLTVGFKYNINPDINVFAEVGYRFTNADYIDDVSTTYAGADAFAILPDGTPSVEYLLQDRSYETGDRIGIKGRQRGNSLQKDAYVMLHFGVSINLSSYKCPPNK